MPLTTHWIQHLNNWQNSGMTQAAYCRERHLNVKTFQLLKSKLNNCKSLALAKPWLNPNRPRAVQPRLPDHLPRIEHSHEPESCTCEHCGKELVKIREDVTEQLDVEPAKFFVHRYLCPVGMFARNTLVAAVKP